MQYKTKIKPIKRIGIMTLATTVALSVPAVSNVIGHVSPVDQLQTTVAHAQQVDNLMISNEITTTFNVNHNDQYEHWDHALTNDGEIPVDGPDFDISNLTYVVKLPTELAFLLNNEYVLDYLFGNVTNFDSAQTPFTMTGYVIDENGERITISKDDHKPYKHISVNRDTYSIEFDFNSFYTENNIEPYFRQSVNGEWFLNNLSFNMSLNVPDSRMLLNDTYEFKTAIVEGKGVDLDNVSNAYSENLVVDYSDKYPNPAEDKSELETAIEELKTYDPEDYPEELAEAIIGLIKTAEWTLESKHATQNMVDLALNAIRDTINTLDEMGPEPEKPEIDTSELEALVKEAKDYDADEYTDGSFAALTKAVTTAEEVLADEGATQEDIDSSLHNLQTAIDGLEEVESKPKPEPEPEDPAVDTSKLEALVKEAKGYDTDKYTEDSFAVLTKAITEAEEVLADEDATQEDVDLALKDLQVAINNLKEVEVVDPNPEPKPEPEPEKPEIDTSELEALVKDAKAYDKDDYTSSSYEALTEAIDVAESILENNDTTQDEVDSALGELRLAIDGLEEVKDSNDKDGDRLPDTATNTYTLMMMGGLLAAAGGVLFFVRRKIA